jgi:hypothetical protein
MAFDKTYFEHLRDDLYVYQETFSLSDLTLTIKLHGGEHRRSQLATPASTGLNSIREWRLAAPMGAFR